MIFVGGVDTNLVDVNLSLVLVDEAFGHAVSPDGGSAAKSLAEVAVNGRSRDGFHSFDLTCRGDVETLWRENKIEPRERIGKEIKGRKQRKKDYT